MRNLFAALFAAVAFQTSSLAAGSPEAILALKSSDEFQNGSFEKQLALLAELTAAQQYEEGSLGWAVAEADKMTILARQAKFEDAAVLYEEIKAEAYDALAGTSHFPDFLYSSGFVNLYTDNISEVLRVVEIMRVLPGAESSVGVRQKIDTLMVALHSHTGNAILASQIFISKIDSGEIFELPPLDQLKLISNAAYTLVEGGDFDLADDYISMGRERLADFVATGEMSGLEMRRVRYHLNTNHASILLAERRFDEIADVLPALSEDAVELGAPTYVEIIKMYAAANMFARGELDEAASNINQVVATLKAVGVFDTLRDAYELQAEILGAVGDYEAALNASLAQKELIKNSEASQNRARLEYMNTRAEILSRSAEIERLKNKVEFAQRLRLRDQFVLVIAGTGILVLSVFASILLRSRQALKRSAANLQVSEKRALAASAAKAAFLANMSHEIRTPLNGLLGMAEALGSAKTEQEREKYVSIIQSSGQSLLTVVNDVLDVSKIDAGKMELFPVRTNVHSLFREIDEIWSLLAHEKGIDLDVKVDPSVPAAIDLDPVRFKQCVTNVISNAVKFTEEGGVSIVASYDVVEQRLNVEVQDTGIGISPDQEERLFSAFEQADVTSTRRYGGTGLGLAISRKLLKKMDGDICYARSASKGAKFLLYAVAPLSDQESRKDEGAGATIELDCSQARILLVDDNQINRMVARTFLTRNVANIVEAENGEEALKVLAENPETDLILLDMHMPVLDGPQTLKRLRASNAPWRDVPVIALTADAMDGDRERYIALGMDGYCAKPIVRDDLLAEMLRVLAGSDPAEKLRANAAA